MNREKGCRARLGIGCGGYATIEIRDSKKMVKARINDGSTA